MKHLNKMKKAATIIMTITLVISTVLLNACTNNSGDKENINTADNNAVITPSATEENKIENEPTDKPAENEPTKKPTENKPTDNPTKEVPVQDPMVNNNPPSQKVRIDNNGFVTTDTNILNKELTITYANKTDKTLYYGAEYILQFSKNNAWVNIPTLPNIAYNCMLYVLKSGDSFTDSVNSKSTYGELKSGHYRIIKEMDMDTKVVQVIAEFNI